MTITLVKLQRAAIPSQPNLRAFFEVKIGDITICDCRIIQQPGCKAYVTGPQKQVNGTYYPLVKMSPALRKSVEAGVLAAAIKDCLIQPPVGHSTHVLPDNSQHRASDLV